MSASHTAESSPRTTPRPVPHLDPFTPSGCYIRVDLAFVPRTTDQNFDRPDLFRQCGGKHGPLKAPGLLTSPLYPRDTSPSAELNLFLRIQGNYHTFRCFAQKFTTPLDTVNLSDTSYTATLSSKQVEVWMQKNQMQQNRSKTKIISIDLITRINLKSIRFKQQIPKKCYVY